LENTFAWLNLQCATVVSLREEFVDVVSLVMYTDVSRGERKEEGEGGRSVNTNQFKTNVSFMHHSWKSENTYASTPSSLIDSSLLRSHIRRWLGAFFVSR